jgi:hypothetical protein
MSCLSDLKLDQLMRGELAAPDEAKQHLDSCEKCRARMKELEAARESWQKENPQLTKETPKQKDSPTEKRPFPWAAVSVGLAAAAAFALWIRPHGPPSPPVERAKGGIQLSMFVSHEGKVRPAAPREIVSPGDLLQFKYSSDQERYVAVLSVDGARQGSIYFPDGETQARKLGPAQDQPLANSTELDNVLGPEKIYGLFCEQPLELEPVRAQLQKFGAMPLLDHCRVIQLSIEKK